MKITSFKAGVYKQQDEYKRIQKQAPFGACFIISSKFSKVLYIFLSCLDTIQPCILLTFLVYQIGNHSVQEIWLGTSHQLQ